MVLEKRDSAVKAVVNSMAVSTSNMYAYISDLDVPKENIIYGSTLETLWVFSSHSPYTMSIVIRVGTRSQTVRAD